jgi:hypothetical protein
VTRFFVLSADPFYRACMAHIDATWRQAARDGKPLRVRVGTAKARTLEQNARFHALCDDLAQSGLPWAGKPRTADAWKVLLVSGHAQATKAGAEMVPGLEGEFVNVRESTASMSATRLSSLIEYAEAFCAAHNITTEAA